MMMMMIILSLLVVLDDRAQVSRLPFSLAPLSTVLQRLAIDLDVLRTDSTLCIVVVVPQIHCSITVNVRHYRLLVPPCSVVIPMV
tara:strand:- start:315 stop:569 length:255 start_codon:yes stop_codon:yes gene_type:complete